MGRILLYRRGRYSDKLIDTRPPIPPRPRIHSPSKIKNEGVSKLESIYKNLQAYMQIENQYQKVMANIYKNNL